MVLIKTKKGTSANPTLSTIYSTETGLESKSCLRREMPATNRPGHGTTQQQLINLFIKLVDKTQL